MNIMDSERRCYFLGKELSILFLQVHLDKIIESSWFFSVTIHRRSLLNIINTLHKSEFLTY